MGRTGDERVAREALVLRRVGHDESGSGFEDRVGAKRDGAVGLLVGEAVGGFEPLAVAIDK